MKQFFSKPINVFLSCFISLLLLFFLFPIEIFDGEVVFEKGLVHFTTKGPLSLSYFIGLGLDPKEMDGIKDFYLLPKGYFMAFLFTFCIPALVSYRVYISNKNKLNTNN